MELKLEKCENLINEKKKENEMEKFIEGIKEEVEDGFINNRGFYTTLMSWKWKLFETFCFW